MHPSNGKRSASSIAGNLIEPSALRSWRLPRNLVALGLVSLFNDASSEIIYPLLPLFLTGTLGANKQFVGLIEGITESASSLLKLPAGWLSDRFRRRKRLVVFGYGLASLARPLLALTTAAWQVLGLRFIDRVGKGLRSAPRDALIADTVSPENRGLAFGFHRAMDHAGAIIGGVASWWLVSLFAGSFRSVFWAAAVPAFVALLILALAVSDVRQGDKETRRVGERESGRAGERGRHGNKDHFLPLSHSPTPPLSHSPTLPLPHSPTLPLSHSPTLPLSHSPTLPLSHPPAPPLSHSSPPRLPLLDSNFKRYLGVLLLFTLGNSSDAFLLLRAEQLGVGVAVIPLLWAVLHVSKSLSSIIGGGLSDRLGRKRLIVSGWIVYAAIYSGFAFSSTQTGMWLLFIIYGFYFGLTEGVEKAFVADLARPERRGTAFGFYNLVIGIGALPASLMTGALWDRFGAATALMIGAGLSLLAAVLLTVAIRESNSSSEKRVLQ